jgi:tetraacyldisaccharide 4'-kinase
MSAGNTRRFIEIVSGRDRSVRAHVARALLRAIEPAYTAVANLRNRMYDSGLKRARSLDRPAISVGNITTGGTGKTPTVAMLAKSLIEAGESPAILLRGYRKSGAAQSDEQVLLSQLLPPSVPVVADADRVRGAAQALQRAAQTSVFLLDDAFQHRAVHREFDLVLIDATCPFGFGHVLPRGLLREPRSGLTRASAFLITHASECSVDELSRIENLLRATNTNAPIFYCDHRIAGLVQIGRTWDVIPVEAAASRRTLAFCGIGNPGSFSRALQQRGLTLMAEVAFDDHHPYTAEDMYELGLRAKDVHADALVTTEKDMVRIAPDWARELPAPLYAARLELEIRASDRTAILTLIRKSLDRAKGA